MKIKILLGVLCLCLFGSLSSQTSFAQADDQTVDIGIIYKGMNPIPVELSSETGFEIVKSYDAMTCDPLVNLYNNKALTIYKMGTYLYNAHDITSPSLSGVDASSKGAFAIQIGEFHSDFQSVFDRLSQLKTLDNQYVFGLGDGYVVYYGNYTTLSEAETALASLNKSPLTESVKVVQLPYTAVGVYESDIPLAIINTAYPYALKADKMIFKGILYRNEMLFKRQKDSDLTMINRLPLAHYLYGVVPKEMSPSWPMDALKAQAIAAKNFYLTQKNNYRHLGFNVTNSTSSQVYGGILSEHPRTNQAVDETLNEALYYGEEIVQCFYYAHSGGYTERAANVWNSDLPYLLAIEDPYGAGAPNDNWTVQMEKSKIENCLNKAGKSVGSLKQIEVSKISESGRVMELIFLGSNGKAVLQKNEIRSVLPAAEIKSTLFAFSPLASSKVETETDKTKIALPFNAFTPPRLKVSNDDFTMSKITESVYQINQNGQISEIELLKKQDPNVMVYDVSNLSDVVFYGKGYGHGVGMSQWGAKKMAEMGMDYKAILAHYYRGTELRQRP